MPPGPSCLLRALESSLAAADASGASAAAAAGVEAAARLAAAQLPRRGRSAAAPAPLAPLPPLAEPAHGAASAAAAAPDDVDPVDTAEALVATAAAAATLAAAAAARDREHADGLESAVTSNSSSPARTAGGGVDVARQQQHLVAATQALGITTDATGILEAHRAAFPLTYKALLARAGGSAPASLGDFPLLVLAPAVLAARQQMHGLTMLREAASRTAAAAGPAGARAAAAFADPAFDYHAARAVTRDHVVGNASPLDLCLGVMPLAQLGLHLWLSHHAFQASGTSDLVTIATQLDFAPQGVLDPGAGMEPFVVAWSRALGTEEDIPHVEVYYLLVEALHRDAKVPESGQVAACVDGALMSWTAFALATVRDWRRDSGGLGGGSLRRAPTLADLQSLILCIQDFGDACTADQYVPGALRPSHLSGHTFHARLVVRGPPPPAPPQPLPPPSAPGPRSRRGRGGSGVRHHPLPPPLVSVRAVAALPGAPVAPRPLVQAPPAPAPVILLPALVLADCSTDLLSAGPLLAAGWVITLSAHTNGSHVVVPGRPQRFPLRHDHAGDVHLDLVVVSGGLTLYDDSAHRRLPRLSFLLDTGAQVSLVGPARLALLTERGSAPSATVTGVSGPPVIPLDSGVLRLIPPLWATVPTGPALIAYEGLTSSAGAAQHVRRVRSSAFPPVHQPHLLASRFNLNTADALRAFVTACPYGVAPGMSAAIIDGTDYSQGEAPAALLKAPPIHASRYTMSIALREATPPGHVWWTDLSNTRPPDFEGHTVSRLFAEERTSYAKTFYAARKDSATLIGHLDELRTWIASNVPGGALQVLRCDFASEVVRQGHGDSIYTAAIAAYCDAHPGFRVVPVAPHSQALNRAENTWARIHAGTMLNARRSRTGPAGWSLMERGAVFQHNHTPAPHALDPAAHRCSRAEALTLQPFDVSSMLGHVGQSGWVHRPDGKANAMRTTADPVLYLCPATSLRGQLVFNLRSFKINVVSAVTLSLDPFACAMVLAASALHRPAGCALEPTPDAYEARLHALLMWFPGSSPEYTVVVHDPITGLPVSLVERTPFLAPDGALVMLDADEAAGPWAHEEGTAAGGVADPFPVAHCPAPATAGPAVAPSPPVWPAMPTLEVRQRIKNMVDHAGLHPANASSRWPLRYRPGFTKSGASGLRFLTYSRATDFSTYRRLHSALASSVSWRRDLSHDMHHGIVQAAVDPVIGESPATWSVLRASLDIILKGDPAAEAAVLQTLTALEPAPRPGFSPGPDEHPDLSGDARCYTEAYLSGVRVLRASLSEDRRPPSAGGMPDLIDSDEDAWGDSATNPISPALAFMAAPDPLAPSAPSSVTAARRLPDFDAPHGWRAAITKEVHRVEGFRAWSLATARQIRADRDLYGDHRVSIGFIVAVLTCKFDPGGDPREPGVLNKFRVAVADKADASRVVVTHSNCVDDITNRIIAAITPAIGAEQDSIDVGGAYFHGTPPDMEHGGRRLYVRIPPWMSSLFPGDYPARSARGEPLFLLVSGNMPGRCDAGRIWQQRFDQFLHAYGLSQLNTDRRVWIGHSERGALIVHDHVDDSRITATSPLARTHFHEAWASEFGEIIESKPLSEDFTGLRHSRTGPSTTAISCGGVLRRLGVLLEGYPLMAGERCDWPLPATALARLQDGPASSPLAPHLVEGVAPILGTIGFIAGLARPDAFFGYCVLSRFAGADRLTQHAHRLIIRLGHYLFTSRDLCLHITVPRLEQGLAGAGTTLDLFECFVDSSHGNGDDGSSYGGFVLSSMAAPPASLGSPGLLTPAPAASSPLGRAGTEPGAPTTGGGGVLAWRCSAPRAGDDSSAAAELRQATIAYKYVVAARLLLTELAVGVSPARPTPFYLDAQAVLDGTTCERLAKKSRWMAMRYAMLRWGIACGSIVPLKRPSSRNPADALTKCLTGPPFLNARARLLGLPLPHPDC